MVPAQDLEKLVEWAFARGFALFPILRYQKSPTGIVRSHATDWSKDPEQWRRWHRETGGCNFGVSCGPSNVIVVDVDVDGSYIPTDYVATWLGNEYSNRCSVVTPSGGIHLYFTAIDSENFRQPDIVPKQINVRAGRGYVVSPWSTTDNKHGIKAIRAYWLWGQYFPPPAPTKLLAHCAPERDDASRIQPAADVVLSNDGLPVEPILRIQANRRATAALDYLRGAVPGERNAKLNQAAFDIGKLVAEGMIDEGVARQRLVEAAEDIGISRSEHKAQSTIRSGLRAGANRGHPEPVSALDQLYAFEVPLELRAIIGFQRAREAPPAASLIPPEPLVERLLYPGDVTVLSGKGGGGKTTLAASLAAASVAGIEHFRFGDFETGCSDVIAVPFATLFVSYEGAEYIDRNVAAWHRGSGCPPKYPERLVRLDMKPFGPLVVNRRREPILSEQQGRDISDALSRLRTANPGLPCVVVLDNATAAVEDGLDAPQVQTFMRAMGAIAATGAAVLILAHPTKSGSSATFGSHLFFSLATTVGLMTVLKRSDDGGEWVQWIEFEKHRVSNNGECLEIRSQRLKEPLVDLPESWGAGNVQGRARQIRDLHVPYVRTMRVRRWSDKKQIETGVVEHVTPKPTEMFKV